MTADKMAFCPVTVAIGVIGGKWKPRILWHLRQEPHRFGDLRRKIPRISEKMLADDLKSLEAAGVLSRRVFHAKAVLATEYDFTAYGRDLIPVLDVLGHWGLAHQQRVSGQSERGRAVGVR
jgi:DNA-binding HxlR family transcriptional regulator